MMPEEKKEIKKDSIKELSKLEKLKVQKLALEARIQLMESKEKDQIRKKENRVKFLTGAFILKKFSKEKEKYQSLFEEFEKYLTRERDQELVKEFFEN
jgi:hypothetical protein